MAFKVVNQSVIDVDTDGATKIESATGKDIVLYPADNIWIKQGTKLIFEGTTPDDYEAKLQATTVTADRDLILPDESGTIATQAYVTSAVSGGSLANTDSLAEGTSNLYYTDARADLRIASANLSDLADVDDSARADTYVLTWDNATTTWIAAPTASTVSDIADLNDVDTTGVVNNSILKYNSTSGNWEVAVDDTGTGGIASVSDDTTPELGGDLITASNRIAFADTGTVSHMNFTTTQFGVNNQTVLSSVKSINFFLDSNGGDTGCGFRIFNNIDPDNLGVTAETDYIFKVDESGDVKLKGKLQIPDGSASDNYVAVGDDDDLVIYHDGTNSYIDDTGTGSLFVRSGTTYFQNANGTKTSIQTNSGAGQTIYYDNNPMFETQATGVQVYGNIIPDQDVTYDLGSTTNKFRDLYLSGTSINLGTATLSASGANLSMGAGSFDISNNTTDDLPVGSTNLYYTDALVDSHLSGGTGVTYASGAISIGQNVGTSNHVQFHCLGVGTPASTNGGEIRATADITAYYSSDARLKENVVEIDEAINKVKQIRGVEFDWSQEYLDAKGGEDNYFVRKHDVGVIAQEIETVLPEVVGTREDGTKAVKYDRIVALLIQAVKEQQSEIDDLKSQINSIQGDS